MKVKQVIYRKLGRKKAFGLAYNDPEKDPAKKLGIIEIDPRQSALNVLDTSIHEKIHMINPKMSEKEVLKMGTQLARFLWKLGYRQVKLK